jgi:hypothetical protein
MVKNILLIIIFFTVTSILNAQDSICCEIEYHYANVKHGINEESKKWTKIKYSCDSPSIAIYELFDDTFKFSYDTFYIADSKYYYKFNNNFHLLFSIDKFESKDTCKFYKYLNDTSEYKYFYTYYLPVDIYAFGGHCIFRYKKYTSVCKNIKNGYMTNCTNEQFNFTDFHGYLGFVRFGIGNHDYFEMLDYKCRNISECVTSDCNQIKDKTENWYFYWFECLFKD